MKSRLEDLRTPKLDGVEATRRIGELDLDPPPRVLVLTIFDDDESVYASLQAGASGFLLKDVPARARDRAQAVAFGYEAGLIVPGSLDDEATPPG